MCLDMNNYKRIPPMNIKGLKIKTWYWFAVAGVAAAVSYPHVVKILSEQFTTYQLHRGNPATYLAVFALYGWWAYGFSIKKWGKLGLKGETLLIGGLVALTLLLHYFFGYNFGF